MALFWNAREAAPKAIRLDASRSARIDGHIARNVSPDGPGLALAVVRSGTVVHAAGYGLADIDLRVPIDQNTIFHLASCGKQFTALGILILAEERLLDLDDPVGRHLPGLGGFGPDATIRTLLYHTSGIRDLYDDAGKEMLARFARPRNVDLVSIYVDLGCPMAAAGVNPGDVFSYSNSGYDLLGAVIERVSGQSFGDFFQRRVFAPLGMKDTFARPDRRVHDRHCATGYVFDAEGNFVAHAGTELDDMAGSGSFYTTVPDLCLYDRVLATNSLVGAERMREASTSGRTNDGERIDYGFGWCLGNYKGIHFADHDGEWIGFYSYICRYLMQPFSIFVLSNHPNIDLVEIANLATTVFR